MKKTAAIIGAALMALALAGCSTDVTTATSQRDLMMDAADNVLALFPGATVISSNSSYAECPGGKKWSGTVTFTGDDLAEHEDEAEAELSVIGEDGSYTLDLEDVVGVLTLDTTCLAAE